MPDPVSPPSPRPIVVGIDDTPAARDAARAAVDAARRTAAPIRLVHGFATALPGAGGARDRELHRRRASLRLEQLRREVQAALAQGSVTAVLRDGPASLVLLAEARSASALYLGVPDGEPPGAVAAVVTARAACPVHLHRAGRVPREDGVWDGVGGGVVVGVDGGPGTAALVAAAAAEAALRDRPLLVLHAWSRRAEPVDGSGPGAEPAVEAAERRLIDGYLAAVRAAPGEFPVEVRIVHGDPVGCLADAGRQAELLVVGRHAGAPRGPSRIAELAGRCAASLLVVPLSTARPGAGADRPLAVRARPA